MTMVVTLTDGKTTKASASPSIAVEPFAFGLGQSADLLVGALENESWGLAAVIAQNAGLSLALSASPTAPPVYEVPVDPASLVDTECCQ